MKYNVHVYFDSLLRVVQKTSANQMGINVCRGGGHYRKIELEIWQKRQQEIQQDIWQNHYRKFNRTFAKITTANSTGFGKITTANLTPLVTLSFVANVSVFKTNVK